MSPSRSRSMRARASAPGNRAHTNAVTAPPSVSVINVSTPSTALASSTGAALVQSRRSSNSGTTAKLW